MTEPHWPADGSGDEADGGRDDSAPGEVPQFPDAGMFVNLATAEDLAGMPQPGQRLRVIRRTVEPVDDLEKQHRYMVTTEYEFIDAAGRAALAGAAFVATLKATDQAIITAARALDKAWHTPRDEATGGWANEWEFRMALDALHEACVGGYDETGYPAETDPARIRWLLPDPTYFPGDYESPRTAPFVQVRVNGELVPGHIVYPWPDGGLVVEPLEVAP